MLGGAIYEAVLLWENGASRVNDCKAIGGSVGEKDCAGLGDELGRSARLGVRRVGRVRKYAHVWTDPGRS